MVADEVGGVGGEVGDLGEADEVALRTGAWHGEVTIRLRFPRGWQVAVHAPSTPGPLDRGEIVRNLRAPAGRAPVAEGAAGCTRPVIVVDDPTRPTPASEVIPLVLSELELAGVPPEDVTIVVATGTHGPPDPAALARKVGSLAHTRCRVLVHDHRARSVSLGRTRFGTPVHVNPEVARSDYLIGIGGVYPQHTTWFGGGSKLLLGVLAERSIANLHYRHWDLQGRYEAVNRFREDLDEIAAMTGLAMSISVHLDEHRRIVRVFAGDQLGYYPEAVSFARATYRAPAPDGVDVVVANAYPMDTSLTFALSKGSVPLKAAAPSASRVLVASCSEGDGDHGLFPLVDAPPYHYRRQWLRRQLVARSELRRKLRRRLSATLAPSGRGEPARDRSPGTEPRPTHVFRSDVTGAPPCTQVDGTLLCSSWDELLERVIREQGGRRSLRVAVYTCAPLQVLEDPARAGRSAVSAGPDLAEAIGGPGDR